MALESWLTKVKSAISAGLDSTAVVSRRKQTHLVGILAFEVASFMSKLLLLCRYLSDAHLSHLRNHTIALPGVRKLISDDDSFLLFLARAELTDSLRQVADSVAALAHRCADPALRHFGLSFHEFADSGQDSNRWVMGWKDMETKLAKKMDRQVSTTAALFREMDELSEAEQSLKKLVHGGGGSRLAMVAELQQRIFWKKQQVKYLRQTSLWSSTFDAAVAPLARAAFTVLARMKYAFCDGEPCPWPRALSSGFAAVFPSDDTASTQKPNCGFLELCSETLNPAPSTLGAAALSLHYANLITVLEKMARAPRAVGAEAREEVYAMLPARVRAQLRARLRGVGWEACRDVRLAAEWRAALGRIAEWLGPVAQDTIRWQGERSFEGRRRTASTPRANVLLLQTLHFADLEKVEAAVTELLVGLNYLWRFQREMATALGSTAGLQQ
ncbi:protein PSK SIMULATOR 1 [Curcuma longa]|uniref:protein PSK SIMULATOR 1 n=1 Tax=Curcuma longa TaxID=136217 RepID=UPI003D9E4F72